MLNQHFKAVQDALRGKTSMRIMKVTKAFRVACKCGMATTGYCASTITCDACGLIYVAASVRNETVNIGGLSFETPIIIGSCPKCHRSNISRIGMTQGCNGCKAKARRFRLPHYAKNVFAVTPIVMLAETDNIQKKVHITWGNFDFRQIICRAKYKE